MNPIALLKTDLQILTLDTVRVWWRLLPQITAIYLVGWLGFQVALKVAAFTENLNVWVLLAIFAAGFLIQLIPIVVILRLAGRELGIRDLIGEEDHVGDDRDNSITHLLAVTLLPFIGICAAFGQLNSAAEQLFVNQMVRNGLLGTDSVVVQLGRIARDQPLLLLGVVVGAYVVRRGLDLIHERSGWRPLGIGVALIEAFFMLVLVLGGIQVFRQLIDWVLNRAFIGWLAGARDAIAGLIALLPFEIPDLIDQLATFYLDEVWPSLWGTVSQPIIWLAIAALVFGTQAMSVAELWRSGRPLANRLRGSIVAEARADRRPLRGIGAQSAPVQRAAVEVREALLGDLDDKYLPTINSLRLILRAGVIFLGSFVVVYSLHQILANFAQTTLRSIVGGHELEFWVIWDPLLDLIPAVALEPMRLCLLAVAFHRCLEVFRARASWVEPSPRLEPAAAARSAPIESAAGSR